MTPFAELPQWMDMGPDEDFATPTADLAGLLKKRLNRKPEGGLGTGSGAGLTQMLDMDSGSTAGLGGGAKGMESL